MRPNQEGKGWASSLFDIRARASNNVKMYNFSDESVASDTVTGKVYFLNALSLDILRRCDSNTTLRQVAQQHTQEYDVPFEVALDYVQQTVAFLADSGLIDQQVECCQLQRRRAEPRGDAHPDRQRERAGGIATARP